MQKKKFVHRDIRPQNILKKGEEYVITSFRSIFKSEKGECNSLAGSPAYASPKLSEAYKWSKANSDISNFSHNAYKSDVFSLGLIFLYMVTLTQFDQQLNLSPEDFQRIRDNMIDYCKYSDNIKKLLKKMLEYNENDRPDFIELRKILAQSGIKINKKSIIVNQNWVEPGLAPYNSTSIVNEIEHDSEPSIGFSNSESLVGGINNLNQVQNTEKCFICEQKIQNKLEAIFIKEYVMHSTCFNESYTVIEKDLVIYESLTINNNQILLNTKVIQNCSCGEKTYFKPLLNQYICLLCFKIWQIDIGNTSNEHLFYKILSLHCQETVKDKICDCFERSVEVKINGKHFLCFKCLEKMSWPYFNREYIYCTWQCCAMALFDLGIEVN